MSIKLNSSGLPNGTGSLQYRGRVYWAVYADESGRILQVNTYTDDLAEARRILACAAIPVLQARLAKLREVRDETPGRRVDGRGPRSGAGARVAAGRIRPSAVPAGRGGKTGKGGSK